MYIPRPPRPHPTLHQNHLHKLLSETPPPAPPGRGSPGCCRRLPPRPPRPQPSLQRQKERGALGEGSGARRPLPTSWSRQSPPPGSSHRWLLAPLLDAPKQGGETEAGRTVKQGGTLTPPRAFLRAPPRSSSLPGQGTAAPRGDSPVPPPRGCAGAPGQAPRGPQPTCWDARGGGCWQRLEPGDRPQHVTGLGGAEGGAQPPSVVTAAQMSPGLTDTGAVSFQPRAAFAGRTPQ